MSWIEDFPERFEIKKLICWIEDFLESLDIELEKILSDFEASLAIEEIEKRVPYLRTKKGPLIYAYSMSINPDGSRKIKGYRSIQHRMTQQMETLPVTPEDDTPEPLVDTIIDGNSVKIVAEIPGMERDKIDINYSSDSVSIHAHDREVEYFKRIRLPVRVDPRSAKVSLKNGVLEISLRKANEKSIK